MIHNPRELEARAIAAAETALAEKMYVAPIDVLVGMRWLVEPHLAQWRQGRANCLEELAQATPEKIAFVISRFHAWAAAKGLKPSETEYLSRMHDHRRLRFSVSGDEQLERAYRTHWASPELSEQKRERLQEKLSRAPELVVISPLNTDWKCIQCGGSGELLIMEGNGPLCLECADLDHLVFLASGDAALTRRAKAASKLTAVVVRFSRARKRYERQGCLIEEEALERAEAECLGDAEARQRCRARSEVYRARADEKLVGQMAEAILRLFPGCPPAEAATIARHTGQRGSGRVGRTQAGRTLDEHALTLAVAAAIRHQHTRYDKLLMRGVERREARSRVQDDIDRILDKWRESRRASIVTKGD
jgi:hypothetical protein